MNRADEYSQIQDKKEEIERYIYYYQKERLVIRNSRGRLFEGKYVEMEYLSMDGKEPHFAIFMKNQEGGTYHFNLIDIVSFYDLFDGLEITIKG